MPAIPKDQEEWNALIAEELQKTRDYYANSPLPKRWTLEELLTKQEAQLRMWLAKE